MRVKDSVWRSMPTPDTGQGACRVPTCTPYAGQGYGGLTLVLRVIQYTSGFIEGRTYWLMTHATVCVITRLGYTRSTVYKSDLTKQRPRVYALLNQNIIACFSSIQSASWRTKKKLFYHKNLWRTVSNIQTAAWLFSAIIDGIPLS